MYQDHRRDRRKMERREKEAARLGFILMTLNIFDARHC